VFAFSLFFHCRSPNRLFTYLHKSSSKMKPLFQRITSKPYQSDKNQPDPFAHLLYQSDKNQPDPFAHLLLYQSDKNQPDPFAHLTPSPTPFAHPVTKTVELK
jgi:hypothetical protein